MTLRVRPARADTALARMIARNTRPLPEEITSLLTWGADEHVLTGLAVGW